jgi:hypothetical protein
VSAKEEEEAVEKGYGNEKEDIFKLSSRFPMTDRSKAKQGCISDWHVMFLNRVCYPAYTSKCSLGISRLAPTMR